MVLYEILVTKPKTCSDLKSIDYLKYYTLKQVRCKVPVENYLF